ncbi:coiled-coil domain-containing protein 81 isoform X2 [Hemicordylus capensis]|uniref:coiled-coil domain-containing protein 81 isoform X2 n=1 Tax=Hemicordylus capensis TaxID=884348 RepID=UPI0023046C23|nr:coiled-coil domain-containing protein 81 isoform X2 [Hemicordylus capensis]
MLDTIHAAILEGGKHLFLTLPKLTSEEVLSIWGTVSEFVEKQLSMNKRPGTGDSVLSGRDSTPPQVRSCNVVMFPRIELKETETIAEENEKPSKETEQAEKENGRKETPPSRRLLSRQAISPAKVTGVSLTEEPEKNVKPKPSPVRQMTPPVDSSKAEQEEALAQMPVPRARSPTSLCQDHGRAGQEMCYVCMQRAQRNIPSYVTEERRRKEKEEDRILAKYLVLKDQDAVQKQQVRALANRELNQKIAAFNLGVAEAIRHHKMEKPVEAYKSYIFTKRPASSTPHQKQEEYAEHLSKQLDEKLAKETKQKQDEDILARLEHVQLAEELAAQRTKFLKDKVEEMQRYKRALDTQIKLRPAPMPPCEPDSAGVIFGKDDMSQEKMEERRKRAREYSEHQLQAAADRKRAAILNQLVDQRKAADMLQRAREQWIAEKGVRFEKLFQMNLAVQEDWKKSIEMKKLRDYEEKLFSRVGDKLLLLDQCANYRRCYQCKRGLNSCGEPSVWIDTKYIPGSRLMV